jgi:Hint module
MTSINSVNTVEVQGKGFIPMEELEIGDYVRSGSAGQGGTFSRVFSFAHLDRDYETEFIQIFSNGKKDEPIELTYNHLMFVNNKAAPVRADAVKVGDALDDQHKVTEIKQVVRRGIYAPVTESGDLVVSGVRASSYVAVMDNVLVDQHAMTHMFFAPCRMICSINFDWCKEETYSKEGYSNLYSWALKMYVRANDFSAPMKHLMTLMVVAILPTWYAMEQFYVAPGLSFAVLGYLIYKMTSKKNTCY